MHDPFSWTCPYCNQLATITANNTSASDHHFQENNKDGSLVLETSVIVCPNPTCREYCIGASLHKTKVAYTGTSSYRERDAEALQSWELKPRSKAKQFPSYIPKAITDDYNEACLIVNDSPKASATLSRRCLQGMIRNYWGISKSRLIDEIAALKGKIEPVTWDAIEAIRGIGNIGAHMEKDINLIVEVEPDEAEQLISLIEFLLNDWYVVRHDREEQKKKVIALGAAKAAAKAGKPPSP